jgi:2-polyprenyl-6-methoxyphenol hydroxylase-like FAD-dependent oxidoreductase
MKVLIIGAGIGGLTAYHSLRKHLSNSPTACGPFIVKIYESHGSPTSTTSSVGGGLGLAPNGLRSIASVAPGAIEYMQERGFPGPIMTFRNSSGRMVGRFFGGRKERYGYDLLMMRRAVVHEALLRAIPVDAVEWEKKVEAVRETDEGVVVEFTDGTSDNADLVLGADGVRSVVREAVFGNKYPAEYE